MKTCQRNKDLRTFPKASAARVIQFYLDYETLSSENENTKKRHQADATPLHHEGCIDFPQKIVANKQQLLLYLDVFLSIQNNQFFTSISIQFKIKFQGAFLTAFSEVYESLLIKRSIVLHKKTA